MANYFSIFLVVVSFVTGIVWLVYALYFSPKQESVTSGGSNTAVGGANAEESAEEELPALVDFCKQMFPIFFGVMIFRSFIYEPFQIPSGSMMPTLLTGDFILVEKFSYGLKDPVTRTELIETGQVERGDVVVFKYPLDERVDYIKRVVGLPGDTIVYRNKQLFIKQACVGGSECNPAQPAQLKSLGAGQYSLGPHRLSLFEEQLGGVTHQILHNPNQPSGSTQVIVPEGHYFAMGDNRDHSADSRSWGFVPEENLVGKAVFIWISFEFERKQEDFLPTWMPTGVRFSRVGAFG
ncbi:signal peptidase I [Agaribacter marinus]|uniref:Signal peptidase I n=1 Tax=Agaribacter marinus TaxID=1431249 RepID=A0AA37T7R6_9ALTE|nr:signal peptidase I [Agaribacter marinus]GLR73045.1 signal peptidase I [Agaribacter marinus]